MSPETIKAVTEAIKPLAEKVGEGAGHLYGVFVQQQVAVGVANLAGAVVAAVLAVALSVLAYRSYRAGRKMQVADWASSYESCYAVALVSTFFAIFAFMIATTCLTEGIMHLLSPEYYALKDIVCTAKGNCP